MRNFVSRLDEVSRRVFITHAAGALLGVTLTPSITIAQRSRRTRSKSVIYLYMSGGMSHIDTFDPKPGSQVQGPVESIKTSSDGVIISQYFPLMAKSMDKVAVIRSMYSTQGAHDQGRYYLHTSYVDRGAIHHPSLGSWIMKLSGRASTKLPGNVLIGDLNRETGAGFLEAKYGPVIVGNPNSGLKHSRLPEDVTPEQFVIRMKLADRFDRAFRTRYKQQQVRAYTDMYDDAIRLMRSKDLEAFDIGRENPSVREAYGRNTFGQGCLLARRLVEKDVRFVEVSLGGWDTHVDNFEDTPARARVLDQALSTLLGDLTAKGLLSQTLVVVATEFGRTPTINENAGRNHHNQAFTCLLAGCGIRGGEVFGRTDEIGHEIVDDRVTIPSFNATIAHAIGVPYDKTVNSPTGRPFELAHRGKPIMALF